MELAAVGSVLLTVSSSHALELRAPPPSMLATALKPFSMLVDGHGGDCVHLPSLREVNYELSQP